MKLTFNVQWWRNLAIAGQLSLAAGILTSSLYLATDQAIAFPQIAQQENNRSNPSTSSPARSSVTWDDFENHVAIVDGVRIRYLVAGQGDPLVLIHGWPQHSLMWHTVAPILAENFTVIVPDLRGAGGSAITRDGYDKRTMAEDIRKLLDQLGHEEIFLAGYDHGAGVAYSFAAMYPDRVRKLAFMEYGLPGFGYEDLLTAQPDWTVGTNWQLSFFTVPDVAEFAFRGQERELLSWFFWHDSANPSAVSQEHFEEYVRHVSKPGALRAGIEYYAAVWRDRTNNQEFARRPLTMPVLGIGGQYGIGEFVAEGLKPVAQDVRSAVIPQAGHWLGDENPEVLAEVLQQFFIEAD
ncbi:MAG: alpha/beta hydrolase [Oculatellaceae cyanobacterium Prado106]|nr:alpha/beta hydrolase [Oculatellaceae cyanobacterium Prado106]